MKEMRPIIALDFPEFDDIKKFLAKFDEEKLYIKIGMELFYAVGPLVVDYAKSLGYSVFLDLKLHDIPNTVASAMKVLSGLGVDIINVHAAGGVEMMRAAKEGLIAGKLTNKPSPKLIAVTQLTSITEEAMQSDQLITSSLEESIIHYSKCALEAGLDGVVCSAYETEKVKAATYKDFICLTPGIRPEGVTSGDQKRVVTPNHAHQIGSDYIVVGRPITRANDPVTAYKQIYKEWNNENV